MPSGNICFDYVNKLISIVFLVMNATVSNYSPKFDLVLKPEHAQLGCDAIQTGNYLESQLFGGRFHNKASLIGGV